MSELPPASRRVVAAAADLGLDIEIVRFPEGTRTAADAARAVRCPIGAIVKSIVLAADGQPVVVFISGSHRVSYDKVAAALGASTVTKADAEQARQATGYAIGGTAPFGYPTPVPLLFDTTLHSYDVVWAAGGTPDSVFSIKPAELLRATGAVEANVADD